MKFFWRHKSICYILDDISVFMLNNLDKAFESYKGNWKSTNDRYIDC